MKLPMKYLFFFLLIIFSSVVSAQSKEESAYKQYRFKISTPPYGLAKVKSLVEKIPNDSESIKLGVKTYQSLSLREKFTYTMIHAEDYAQNCDIIEPMPQEHTKIFAYLDEPFPEYTWSERQRLFLNSNRDSVMSLIKESVTRSKRMGLNYKVALYTINAKEMIPFIISNFQNDRKDMGLLTLLFLIMKDNEYQPFLASESYRKLYGDTASHRTYIQYNKANEDLIISRAMNFYHKNK
ncbi:hypothetical protein LPB86_17805 [Pedobacter sp. MC2016-14]|uniref:hypothetical protein n=1 Tax=Pedobacter sp. MC2016-14 TaxID=2897327 RepID=UPI001E4F74DA|nr:hypothetical protein [Pedobacter sp. MC2016-14]MCD0490100.1 hypothetical protein [Pedobacter sp. MC2016-14]